MPNYPVVVNNTLSLYVRLFPTDMDSTYVAIQAESSCGGSLWGLTVRNIWLCAQSENPRQSESPAGVGSAWGGLSWEWEFSGLMPGRYGACTVERMPFERVREHLKIAEIFLLTL